MNLLVELLVEELPPKALKKLGDAFANLLAEHLRSQGLASAESVVTPFATPRRLAAHITQINTKAPDKVVQQKLMPVSVGLDDTGSAKPALVKKLQALGLGVLDVASLRRAMDGKVEVLFYDRLLPGVTLTDGLQQALDAAIANLPIPKVMSYPLASDSELPGWSSVKFVRPAHGLVALHGSAVVPVRVLGLRAGNTTQGHRFEARTSPVVIQEADHYEQTLQDDGAVIASFAKRRAEMVRQLECAAAKVGQGACVIQDDDFLDEVTALVERPNVLVCQFDPQFLKVPQECLILTMKANQKYFPLPDAKGQLTHHFLVVSNITPADPSAVISGNERVVRPRLSDAQFFFDQDCKKTLESRVASLSKVVYHNKLGTQGERMARVVAIAEGIVTLLHKPLLLESVKTAARLAKTDLLTDMVGEFPELQGIMGGYYARHDGLGEDIACAIEDHYKPRFAGDSLPRNDTGIVVALADKLETLVGMFGIGNLPTGEKDPFALRRHALGVIRLMIEKNLPLNLSDLISVACAAFAKSASQTGWRCDESGAVSAFVHDRLSGYLREQGYSVHEVDAVLSLCPQYLSEVPKRLAAVRAFSALPEAPALAAANKRIGNILKKADVVAFAQVNQALLTEPAEIALYDAILFITPRAQVQLVAGDYTASLQTLSALQKAVDAFFDSVMVNAEAPDLRSNRLGLLKTLHQAMNQVADLARLA
jgi:glycyl-tRNA synthetase beta chain